MVAVSICKTKPKTYKVRCPECHGRICDMVIEESKECNHRYKVITTENRKNNLVIKCQKCGVVVGISMNI